MKIIGIDPGQTGGIVQIDGDGKILKKFGIPIIKSGYKVIIDLVGLRKVFEEISDSDFIFIEKVHSMPRDSPASAFKFGSTFGIKLGLITASKIPFDMVAPNTWTKKMHADMDKTMNSKKRSLIVAQRLYPNEKFLLTPKCSKPHDGLIDATLIAEYGRRYILNR